MIIKTEIEYSFKKGDHIFLVKWDGTFPEKLQKLITESFCGLLDDEEILDVAMSIIEMNNLPDSVMDVVILVDPSLLHQEQNYGSRFFHPTQVRSGRRELYNEW